MKKIYKGMLAGAALLTAPFTQAAVIEWEYTVTLKWTAVEFENGGANSNAIVTDTLVSWGASGGDHTDSTQAPINSRSALEISNSPATGTVFTNDLNPEATNTLTHYNNAIAAVYDSLVSGSVRTTLDLILTDPAGSAVIELSKLFVVDLFETPNTTCNFPSVSVCDDIFVISFGELTEQFVYDGVTYFLTISELSGNLGLLPDATCAAVGVASGCVGFTTPERAFTPIQFAFIITAIPEPAMLGVFGLGLLGLRAFGRRRLAKK